MKFVLLKNVSIPHRQAKNNKYWVGLATLNLVSIPHRQAKNVKKENTTILKTTQFQFLIGRLKTKTRRCQAVPILQVSIPHRQAKNAAKTIDEMEVKKVSIPHRQAKNELKAFIENLSEEFQFLIGRLKTSATIGFKLPSCGSFNSSQVG